MDKTTAALLGAIVGLTPLGAAHAALGDASPSNFYEVSSYGDLLAPVNDAVARLRVADETPASPEAKIDLADGWLQFQFGAPPPIFYGPPPPPPPPPAYYGYGYAYPYPAPYFHHHHHHHHHWGT